jgi:hypothetical protein
MLRWQLILLLLIAFSVTNVAAGARLYRSCMEGCANMPPPFQLTCWVACLAALAIPE